MSFSNENDDIKFISAHNFLTETMIQNHGVLKVCDIKKLQQMLNNYVAFSEPSSSKYAYDMMNGNGFFAYQMSVSQYKNKSVGDSKLLVDNMLSLGYRIDLTKKENDTLNKIIKNTSLASRTIAGLSAGQLCNIIKNTWVPEHLTNSGNVPSKPKIVIGKDNKIEENSLIKNRSIMLVFYN